MTIAPACLERQRPQHFDRTITLIDSAEYALEHADGDWRRSKACSWREDHHREVHEDAVRMISIPRDVMLRGLDAVILPA